jgi:hypothetical protein
MVTLTSWLDGLMADASRRTGIPREQLSAHIGGEFIGTMLEVISGLFSKGWVHPVVNGIAGAIALSYAVFARGVSERLRREMLSLGSHLAFRALELVKAGEFSRSLSETAAAIRTGGIGAALSTVLATPEEVMAKIAGTSPPTQVVTTAPVGVASMRPISPSPATPPPPSPQTGALPPKAF